MSAFVSLCLSVVFFCIVFHCNHRDAERALSLNQYQHQHADTYLCQGLLQSVSSLCGNGPLFLSFVTLVPSLSWRMMVFHQKLVQKTAVFSPVCEYCMRRTPGRVPNGERSSTNCKRNTSTSQDAMRFLLLPTNGGMPNSMLWQ